MYLLPVHPIIGGMTKAEPIDRDTDKKLAAEAAVAEVRDGMVVGLGTGTTAAHAIAAVGALVRERGFGITAVATSDATEHLATSLGIPCRSLREDPRVDLTIDGVDEIDARLFAIKGAGGAMLREKIVASAATRMVAIADGSKRVAKIGGARVPVEFLESAQAFVERELVGLGGLPELRVASDGARYRTDQGNLVLDCRFAAIDDAPALDRALSAIPGVFGHGLFLTQIDAAYIADAGIVTKMERKVG